MKKTVFFATTFAVTLLGAAYVLTQPAGAQALNGYLATGENAGGSLAERATLNTVPRPAFSGPVGAASSADINNGAYTDPTPYIRQSLVKEHMYLGHPNAVRSAGRAAFASESAYVDPNQGPALFTWARDPSIISQH